jgi:betaine-aldehyde dehydrogenase/aminobutyraldehyde dehydrogenase
VASIAAEPLNLVGGERLPAVDGDRMDVANPATGDVIASVPAGGPADVDRAVAAAKDAFGTWSSLVPRERAEILHRLADAMDARLDEFVALESTNVGKPLPAARDELPMAVDTLRYFAGACRVAGGDGGGEFIHGTTSIVRREPIGVVASIGPWNYPLQTLMMKVAPGLAAGNTVVAKPSQRTPLTTLLFAEVAAQILPPGVLNVVTGAGSVMGDALVGHPDIGLISLTGDTATGRHVARTAAATLARTHLELGGNAPLIVLDDADLAAVTAGIRAGSYYNAGQDCTAAARVLVAASVYNELIERLVPAVESLVVGDPAADQDVEMGPVISEGQRERVLGFVERARASGATVLTGAEAVGDRGFFVSPTIVTDVKQTDEIVQNEVFGPVVTVQAFDDEAEALSWANGVEHGLSASVWTRGLRQAHVFARQLDFGTVWINEHLPFTPEAPFGGFKQSGYGSEMSMHGLHEYTRVKHVLARMDPGGGDG